jgi:hypothetical protein
MPLDCQPGQKRHEEPLDVAHDAFQRDSLDVEPVLGVESAHWRCFDSSSKNSAVNARGGAAMVGIAVFRRSNVRMIASARTCPSNGKALRQGAQIVKVLHAAVRHAELHHRLELLSHHGLLGIGQQQRRRPVEDRWKRSLDGRGRDGVSEPNIDLHGNPRPLQIAQEGDTDPFIVRIFLDALRFDARRVKLETVFIDRKRTDLLEDGFKAARIVVAVGEKIRVPSWAVGLLRPEFKKQRALENENLLVFRLADAEEKAFQSIFREKQPKILIPLPRKIRQALPNRSREIGDILGQDRDSI